MSGQQFRKLTPPHFVVSDIDGSSLHLCCNKTRWAISGKWSNFFADKSDGKEICMGIFRSGEDV